MASHRRGPWSQGEDAYLVQLVHTQGALNWVRIAQLIGSRSPKQCRERYHQNLKPSLNHEPISPEEGLQIERLVAEMGKRWAEIARRLHGRSDNAVKNWWNGSMNRRRRLVVRRGMPSRCSQDFDESNEQLSFARPAEPSHRPLSINAYDSRRPSEIPLPSPSVSEVSRADSMEGAPSLVSDTGSSFSISPRVAPSAMIELPPLAATRQDFRRPSLPVFQFSSGAFVSDADTQAQVFSARFHPDQKTPGPSPLQQSTFQRYEFPMGDRSPHSLPRGHFHAVNRPESPARLPSISTSESSRERAVERDNRMKMSSLLG